MIEENMGDGEEQQQDTHNDLFGGEEFENDDEEFEFSSYGILIYICVFNIIYIYISAFAKASMQHWVVS